MTIESNPSSRSEMLWLAAILAVVIALRFVAIGADPMPELDGGFISDAGTWWKNARLHTLWGVWSVDDGNYALLTAPAYTLVLRGVFGIFGVGYAQGYLASSVSGVLTVVLMYLVVRREAGGAAALLAAAFIGINIMTIAYDRAAYPEAFQLMMMTATVGAIMASPGRTWLAALGGAGAAIVLLSKPPGLVLAPVASATWAALWLVDWKQGGSRFEWRNLVVYCAVGGAILGFVGIVYLRPHAHEVWLHFHSQMAEGHDLGARATDRVLLFGTRLGFRLNGFFSWEWYLLIVAAGFGAARIVRVIRRPVTAIEIACWIWVAMGIGVMGMQTYQQDRRFLFLIPPLSVLSALALAQVIEIGESAWTAPRARRIAAAGAAALLGMALFYYLVPLGVWKMIRLGALLGMTWSYGIAGGLLLSVMIVVAALLAAWRMPRMQWRGNLKAQLAVAALAPLLVLWRTGPELLQRSRGLENTSRILDRISAGWPDADRYVAGWSAGTLTLMTRLIPVNHELQGPSAAERFRPQLELYAATPGIPPVQSPMWLVPGLPAKVDCAQLPAWSDAGGRPRFTIHIYVEPDRLAACQAAVIASGAGTS